MESTNDKYHLCWSVETNSKARTASFWDFIRNIHMIQSCGSARMNTQSSVTVRQTYISFFYFIYFHNLQVREHKIIRKKHTHRMQVHQVIKCIWASAIHLIAFCYILSLTISEYLPRLLAYISGTVFYYTDYYRCHHAYIVQTKCSALHTSIEHGCTRCNNLLPSPQLPASNYS